MKATIQREHYTDKQVTGTLTLKDGRKNIFTCKTLELPWRDNERDISCIPTGKYRALKRVSEKYKHSYHIKSPGKQEVNGRSFVLIHPGNYYTDIRGCILIGSDFVDLNDDGYSDVTASKKSVRKLIALAGKEFDLVIKGEQPSFDAVENISDIPDLEIAEGDKAIVVANSLKIRRIGEPDAEAIPNVLPNGYAVNVNKIKGDWAKVEVTFSGWIQRKHMRKA
ncbi:MAG: DUF5675 family protein [Granulosicoccus sp.]